MISIDQYGDSNIIISFDNGNALIYGYRELFNRGNFQRVKLAPVNDDSSEICFDTMRISECNKGPVLFDYHIQGTKSPQVSYSDRVDSKRSCQLFPQRHAHLKTLSHSPNIAVSAYSLESLIFMMDLEYNDILIHVGSSIHDCHEISRYHICEGKIVSIASYCNLPLLFVGIDTGQILIFYFREKFELIDTIDSPCSCSKAIPIQISICKSQVSIGNQTDIQFSILYQGCSNFITTFSYTFSIDKYRRAVIDKKRPVSVIRNTAIIVDFRICCCNTIFLLVRSDDGCLFVMKYDLLTGNFISSASIRQGFSVKSWTVTQCLYGNDCCALFVLHKCEKDRCDASSFVVAYCCESLESIPSNRFRSMISS